MTTESHPAPVAEKLTAEEEEIRAAYRISAADKRWRYSPITVMTGKLLALLDASRAETEAWHQRAYNAQVENYELRSLAAELVEGLAGMVARYGDFTPGKPFLFPPDHHINPARDLLSRARAQGIGGGRAP